MDPGGPKPKNGTFAICELGRTDTAYYLLLRVVYLFHQLTIIMCSPLPVLLTIPGKKEEEGAALSVEEEGGGVMKENKAPCGKEADACSVEEDYLQTSNPHNDPRAPLIEVVVPRQGPAPAPPPTGVPHALLLLLWFRGSLLGVHY